MATQVQFRGGTTAQNNAFTGASKELTVDTDKDVVVVHDGATAGGHPLMAEDGSNSALALGSAGSPSLKWDSNTGIYSPGADQLGLSTGGSTRLYINGSGQAVIGGTSPLDNDKQLTLTTTATSGGLGILSPNNGRGDIFFGDTADDNVGQIKYSHINDSLTIRTNAADQLTINSSGSVGIGQTSPSAKLHIEGTSDQLKLTYTSVASYIHEVHSNGDYSIAKDSSERLRINAGGVLSMGDPITNGGWRVFVSDEGTANQRGRMTFRAKNGTAASQEVLQAYLGSTENFRLRADGGGFFGSSLGVGVTSPRGTLHLHTSGATRFDLTNTTTGTGSGDGTTISIDSSTGALNIIQREAQPINFSTSNSQKAVIDAAGRLLVGCSTSSDNISLAIAGNSGGSTADSKLLLVYEGSAPADGDTLASLSFTDNAHLTASGKYAASITAQRDGGTWTSGTSMPGRLVFSTTADSAAAPTARMTVKSDGTINFANVQTFADDTAAGTGGLVSGDVYKTSAGDLKIKA